MMTNASPMKGDPAIALHSGRRIRALLADEPFGLDRLRTILSTIPQVQIIGTASSGAEARAIVETARPDLVIVNVEMGDCSGFDVAAATRGADIVFLASSSHFAADAFKVNAMGYLLKPVVSEALRDAVARARHAMLAREALALSLGGSGGGPRREGFWVKSLGRAVMVPLESITRIEAHGEYVLLHADGRTHMTRLKMNDLEAQLEGHWLMRVHRSSFVRLDEVIEVKRDGNRIVEVLLRDGQWVAVGARYTKFLRARLAG